MACLSSWSAGLADQRGEPRGAPDHQVPGGRTPRFHTAPETDPCGLTRPLTGSEPWTRIELALSAWQAEVLPLNYQDVLWLNGPDREAVIATPLHGISAIPEPRGRIELPLSAWKAGMRPLHHRGVNLASPRQDLNLRPAAYKAAALTGLSYKGVEGTRRAGRVPVSSTGFEPATSCSGGRRSIH